MMVFSQRVHSSSWIIAGCMTFLGAAANHSSAATLSLDDYLKQVRTANLGYKASEANKAAVGLSGVEIEMVYAPVAFGTVQHIHDAKPNSNAALQGTLTDTVSYGAGIGKTFSTGTQVKLSFGLNEIQIFGQNPPAQAAALAPHPEFMTGATTLEVSHPLWKNRNGADTKNQIENAKAQASAATNGEKYKEKLILAEAENLYRRLSLAKETVELQLNSEKRFERLRNWNAKRVSMQLADKTDLLQSEAALAGKNIEIRQVQDDLKTLSRAFNGLRGQVSDSVPEELAPVTIQIIASTDVPSSPPNRLDVEAAKDLLRAADAKTKVESEKYKPNIEIFGQYSLNGRRDWGVHADPTIATIGRGEARTDTVTDVTGNEFPTRVIGLRLSAPLAGDIRAKRAQGLALEREAARLTAEQKTFEAKRDWVDLSKRLADAKDRLKLATNLEVVQKQKLDHEQEKQKSGRSTTYQVLMFEQDFVSSQLNTIRIKAECFELISRMKTYGTN